MATVKSTIATANSVRGKINPYYDIRVRDFNEIHNNCPGLYETISTAFNFGYAQGIKAEKAAQRKAAQKQPVKAKPLGVGVDYSERMVQAI